LPLPCSGWTKAGASLAFVSGNFTRTAPTGGLSFKLVAWTNPTNLPSFSTM
jgi:hypothetical protein